MHIEIPWLSLDLSQTIITPQDYLQNGASIGGLEAKLSAESDVRDVILVPIEALANTSQKKKNDRLISRYSGIGVAFDTFSKNPSRYPIMLISHRLADPSSFDMLRKVKALSPGTKVVVAFDRNENNGDSEIEKNLENLPFVDRILPHPFESVNMDLISTLLDNNNEKDALLTELRALGAEIGIFEQCTADQLRGIITGLRDLITRTSMARDRPSLSEIDRKILRDLIFSKGRVSSLALSKSLDIPLTTLQRKRKWLEAEFLETRHTLKYEKFGLRKAVLFINTFRGHNRDVGEKLLSFSGVLAVHKSIGAHNIDLHVEVVIKDNNELLGLIEKVKSTDGVKEVMWSEILQVIGTNNETIMKVFSNKN